MTEEQTSINEEKYGDVITKISSLSVLELAELVKVLENKFGVSATAMASAGNGGGEAEAEVKDSFNVILKDVGGAKINVIKAVKEITGMGLKEAKDLVDGVPKPIKQGVKKEEAEEIKKKLEDAGAVVEVQ